VKNERKPNYYPLLRGSMNPMGPIDIDPQGSYTGVPVDLNDKPIQDADDL